ncbi:amino acid ABC transporter permease [Pseudomonas agarici]|uniref:Glutamate/aspartate import permease protein GltK n=1 Tax=Pseudomonas agarici TaxID=46677 RepID=A0A0X1T1I2_PSEAA|nr:amino acid ABC transporter permease [Pseudomonas agarici]AMB85920.1 amino acid ABC transporter permease [Pseudomonas agarici]NWB90685.1 amino acid ABC transporter permease [Pseudomonas agarici]NWC07412.1 amino acid ABC transporter permease [Pseudomonas agarici]SEK45320.1 glutamate/aspartate transport system permease protein [Pseudomonas agarici]
MLGSFDTTAVLEAVPLLWQGLVFSLELTLVALVGGMAFGILLAVVRQLNIPILSQIAKLYIVLMRSVPLILVLFWFFFLVPLAIGHFTIGGQPIPVGARATAFITFTMFEAAFYAEIIRSGLRSISVGQYEAAQALGISTFSTYSKIIIPQVLRATAPIVVTQTIILFQDTSLVYVLSLTDFLGAASKTAQRDGTLIEMYTTVALGYLLLCVAGSELAEFLKDKNNSPKGNWIKRAVNFRFSSLDTNGL